MSWITMAERLRSRDPRNNTNKCYSVFFDDIETNEGSNLKAKIKVRSPPKKCRESPTKKKRKSPMRTDVVGVSVCSGIGDGIGERGSEDDGKKQQAVLDSNETVSTSSSSAMLENRRDEKKEPTITATEWNTTIVDSVSKDEQQKHVVESETMESESSKSTKRKYDTEKSDSGESMENVDKVKRLKIVSVKDQMLEIFQPWALKTYGDQAKTKTITRRKKNRILKALDGKEQNNPDSSKFRFWVKSKGFTVKRPENFSSGDSIVERATQLTQTVGTVVDAQDTPSKDHIDLFVASTIKDTGEKVYRLVAVVEEFFEIIYGIHVEQGGRNGRHAGQKRTYRIITETYAFLPREAVTKFLGSCPTCKKNLRPFSPSRFEDTFNESSSEYEALNYSSPNESSVDSFTYLASIRPFSKYGKAEGKASPLVTNSYNESMAFIPKCDTKEAVNEFHGNSMKNAELKSISIDDGRSTPNYYQFLKKFYTCTATKIAGPAIKAEPKSEITTNTTTGCENLDSSIDLTINQASSININIGNSLDVDKTSDTGKTEKSDEVFINTVDVSINMSTANNELKISCKTTPPKKRYSVNKPPLMAASQMTTDYKGKEVVGCAPCAINLSKKLSNPDEDEMKMQQRLTKGPLRMDLNKVKPITSTYLKMTRSFGLSDEDALKIDELETLPTPVAEPVLPDPSPEDAYAGLMKDADKLKLMLLAWNYQNSNAIRNGSEAPDLGVVGGLWAQYQSALALNAKQPAVSPVNRAEQSSPIENQDETNSSGQKDEDDGSEDDSDDKLDQNAHDPERLKAFNMFVRLFVDENLDRMIPISKQPKEKIQAIIDSCARQFPEFCERSRKRIRTYLKSCRRNKKAREGWDNTSRPTPAHLTSVQAEQILAIACENESMNAKRMRIGLDPISQSLPLNSNNSLTTDGVVAPSISYPGFRTTPSTTVSTSEMDTTQPPSSVPNSVSVNSSARSSPIGLTTTINSPQVCEAKAISTTINGTTVTNPIASPLYRPTEFTSPATTLSPYSAPRPPPTYPTFFPSPSNSNATPTDLSMKQHPSTTTTSQPSTTTQSSLPPLSTANTGAVAPSRPPLLSHKLNPNEINAVRQLITGYRESAAFLLRSADELEQLLLQQQ